MRLYSENENYKLYQGNMLDMLSVINPNSIDSIITDPPYELNFMNKGWDSSGIAFQKSTWGKCLTALKPGGYLLAFGGSRTYHRIACAIEDAGFEIRDTIMWLYGSGFPKSLNIGLAIDKKNGVDNRTGNLPTDGKGTDSGSNIYNANNGKNNMTKQFEERIAKNEWGGWGTALKPSFEPIIVARKPFTGSLVDNVIKYGVGGLNIDECRVGNDLITTNGARKNPMPGDERVGKALGMFQETEALNINHNGRFPANTILTYDDDNYNEVCGDMPDTSGGSKMTYGSVRQKQPDNVYKLGFTQKERNDGQIAPDNYGDSGSASRYFYCAKASKKDRDEGLQDFEEKKTGELQGGRKEGSAGSIMLNANGSTRVNPYAGSGTPKKNTHPTVKPCDLMQYLIRLVTPNGGTVLDPFNGSGSTGKAVMYENREHDKGYKYIGIELTEEYLPISKARIDYACISTYTLEQAASQQNKDYEQMSLF